MNARFPCWTAKPADCGVLHVLQFAFALSDRKLCQFLYLAIEPLRTLSLFTSRLSELRQPEDGKQEHDCEQQRRQGIDEARPVIDMPLGAAVAGPRTWLLTPR